MNDANEIGSPGTASNVAITEVAPWQQRRSYIAADWFEVTNTSANAVNITGWKMDDNSNSFAAAVPLSGITSIAPGESVIFLESDSPSTVVPAFKTLWFGANPPAGLQVGIYSGSGVGLEHEQRRRQPLQQRPAVFVQASVNFGASPAVPSLPTFDNAAALGNVTILQEAPRACIGGLRREERTRMTRLDLREASAAWLLPRWRPGAAAAPSPPTGSRSPTPARMP